jgi:thiosulfate dehydrogenase
MKKFSIALFVLSIAIVYSTACNNNSDKGNKKIEKESASIAMLPLVDTNQIPNDSMGNMIRYGRALMLNTAYYIGPKGIVKTYLGNKMNCTNCHRDAGTKPFAFNLMKSHDQYPQYRAREGKVLSLAERVNNCVMRPHNGKPLPLDSREMLAFLAYLKWINGFTEKHKEYKGEKPLEIEFIDRKASSDNGKILYTQHCVRCHGANGEGQMQFDDVTYVYPPLWGKEGYQPGSSMHRIIKQAQWLKANMPHDSATWQNPVLTDAEAFDIAAFVNDDAIHSRPNPKTLDYPNAVEKAIDYGVPPHADTFSASAHKYGPYKPIIKYWKEKRLHPKY